MINNAVKAEIINTFALWYTEKKLSKDRQKWLYENTIAADYDGPGAFFTACGYLDDAGELTDEGKRILREFNKPGADPAHSVDTPPEDTFEDFDARTDAEAEIINSVFAIWYKGGRNVDDRQRELLKDSAEDFDFYDTPEELFSAWGLLDNEGKITEYGERVLGAANEDPAGFSVDTPADDRTDPQHEPAKITPEEWAAGNFYAVTICCDSGNAEDKKQTTVYSYEDYSDARNEIHENGYYITSENPQTAAEYLPGYLSYEAAVNDFQTSDDRILELKSFPSFSATAKIKQHDRVIIAADTGAGKSSLAINILNDVNDEYPVIYFNLEMDLLTILQRLVAIRSGFELDRIEGYKNNERTAAVVNATLRAITARKPLQIIQDVYSLEKIEEVIKVSTANRNEPTIVIIDHSLLVNTERKTINRYDRFTTISEGLTQIALNNNVILFVLLQQSRSGKADEDKRPRNDSLKETGSWENDATHVVFLWRDPVDPTGKKKSLLLTKNRRGSGGEFALEYLSRKQIYKELKDGAARASVGTQPIARKQTPREKQREKLIEAYEIATVATNGKQTRHDIAEAAGVSVATVTRWMKEYGGFTINGIEYDPAGIDDAVAYTGFVRLTLSEQDAADRRFNDGKIDVIG